MTQTNECTLCHQTMKTGSAVALHGSEWVHQDCLSSPHIAQVFLSGDELELLAQARDYAKKGQTPLGVSLQMLSELMGALETQLRFCLRCDGSGFRFTAPRGPGLEPGTEACEPCATNRGILNRHLKDTNAALTRSA